ncbi:MAG: IS1595 family transposase [Dehalococcoidales bacterium]|nr:IS1595 family transposase [Dehalococcoidales bacterium]
MNEPKTLVEAIKYFSDPDVCLEFVAKLRWSDGVTCPTCGSKDVRYIKTRHIWECKSIHPKRQFSIKVGTIFEDSAIGLDKWLAAIWMIANAKNGISSYEISRSLGVTQKTAWFMMHRIRLAMGVDDFKFNGIVEADETFIGGKSVNMHKSKREKIIKGRGSIGKVAVMGLLERHTRRVQTKIIPDTSRNTIPPTVRHFVENGSNLITDALAPYKDLDKEYVHEVIDHAEAYARGHVHTNGIENFWSLLKRAIKGTYICVESCHLTRYLGEQTFRFNNRKDDDAGRFEDVVAGIIGKRLTYNELIGLNTTPA